MFRITRTRTDLQGENEQIETVCGITSLLPSKADPQAVLGFNRQHWAIENKLHCVRDVTFDEDRCRIRKGAGPQVMATLRNLAISILRKADFTNIAEGLRTCTWGAALTFRLLGVPQ